MVRVYMFLARNHQIYIRFYNKMPSLNYDIIIAASEGRLDNVIQLHPQCNEQVFLAEAVYEALLNKHSHLVEWFKNNVILNKKCLSSPLPALSYEGELETLKTVIDLRIFDVNSWVNLRRDRAYRRPNIYTPLTAACNCGHEEIVRYLMSIDDVNVNLQDNFGLTPLETACENNRLEIVKILTRRKDIDVNCLSNGNTSLVTAVNKRYNVIVKHLLKQDNTQINLLDGNGHTPLTMACKNRNVEAAKLLTQMKDIDVNVLTKDGTPLMIATKMGCADIVKNLLEDRNIQINLPDGNGDTPLATACRNGYLEVVKLLTQSKDVDINNISEKGSSLLTACAFNHMHIARYLLVKHECLKDNVLNIPDNHGNTPLHYVIWPNEEALHAKYENRPNIIDTFTIKYSLYNLLYIERQIYDFYNQDSNLINAQDNHGNTPLHLAYMLQHERRSELYIGALISYGTDMNIANNKTKTPIYIAEQFCPKLKQFLNLFSLQNMMQTEIWFQRLKISCFVVLSICLMNKLGRQS